MEPLETFEETEAPIQLRYTLKRRKLTNELIKRKPRAKRVKTQRPPPPTLVQQPKVMKYDEQLELIQSNLERVEKRLATYQRERDKLERQIENATQSIGALKEGILKIKTEQQHCNGMYGELVRLCGQLADFDLQYQKDPELQTQDVTRNSDYSKLHQLYKKGLRDYEKAFVKWCTRSNDDAIRTCGNGVKQRRQEVNEELRTGPLAVMFHQYYLPILCVLERVIEPYETALFQDIVVSLQEEIKDDI